MVFPNHSFQKKKLVYQAFCKCLAASGIEIEEVRQEEIIKYIKKAGKILFTDKEECSAYDTLYRFILHECYQGGKFQTYSEFLRDTKKGTKLLEIYLRHIQEKGVFVLNMVAGDSRCHSMLEKEIDSRFFAAGLNRNSYKIPKEFYRDFFDELYSESYAESIASLNEKVAVDTSSPCGKLKDCSGKYYNVKDGERHTVGQPETYKRTIYFVGACLIYGLYSEDKNTIESFLQKRLNNAQYSVRVVNCGSVSYWVNIEMALARIMDIPLKKEDMLVLCTNAEGFQGIPELDLADVLEKNQVSVKWLLDGATHCNHKVNNLYADAIFDTLQPILSEKLDGGQEFVVKATDVIKHIYIDQYFADNNFSGMEKVGAIVMNCNPFTYGHRYLTEQALGKVDFLIIFVVEEDRSVFSFEERFAMVSAGVADLRNIKVVPSGPFILSQTTFPEYFIKTADEDLVRNVENDITIFAEKIAPHLHINYRFVGEEPEDAVTGEYNRAMKRILPKYGIELVEIPRKKQGGDYISASLVRECLERNSRKALEKLVPKTTMDILFLNNE